MIEDEQEIGMNEKQTKLLRKSEQASRTRENIWQSEEQAQKKDGIAEGSVFEKHSQLVTSSVHWPVCCHLFRSSFVFLLCYSIVCFLLSCCFRALFFSFWIELPISLFVLQFSCHAVSCASSSLFCSSFIFFLSVSFSLSSSSFLFFSFMIQFSFGSFLLVHVVRPEPNIRHLRQFEFGETFRHVCQSRNDFVARSSLFARFALGLFLSIVRISCGSLLWVLVEQLHADPRRCSGNESSSSGVCNKSALYPWSCWLFGCAWCRSFLVIYSCFVAATESESHRLPTRGGWWCHCDSRPFATRLDLYWWRSHQRKLPDDWLVASLCQTQRFVSPPLPLLPLFVTLTSTSPVCLFRLSFFTLLFSSFFCSSRCVLVLSMFPTVSLIAGLLEFFRCSYCIGESVSNQCSTSLWCSFCAISTTPSWLLLW